MSRTRTELFLALLGGLLVVALLASLAVSRSAAAATYPFAEEDAIAQAVTHIVSQQQDDGGIDSFGSGSSTVGGTARTVVALAAAGYAPEQFASSSGNTMIDYLASQAIDYTHAGDDTTSAGLLPGQAGLLLLSVAAVGADPTDFGGMNIVTELNDNLRPTGAYSTTASEGFSSGAASVPNQAFVLMGLAAAGEPVPASAVAYLRGLQGADGSWSSGNLDLTGYAVVALLASGQVAPDDPAITSAIAFFRATQSPDGLWGTEGSGEPANSSGWVMQALTAAGAVPSAGIWQREQSPRAALVALQQPDGRIGQRFVNTFSTIEAIYGLTDQPIVLGQALRTERGLSWMNGQQNDDGSWGFFGAPDPGTTLDALFAFVAGGYDPASVTAPGGNASPLDYLQGAAFAYTRDESGLIFPAQTGKLLVGVVASGGNPNAFGDDPNGVYEEGLPLVDELLATYQPATGAYSTTASEGFSSGAASATNQAFALLGLAAAEQSIPLEALGFLASLQDESGAWGGVDTTAIALQAMIAAGPGDVYATTVADGLAYLRAEQDEQGGWGNANSTAYALQALLAAGESVATDWVAGGSSPYTALAAFQKPDGPAVFAWQMPPAFGPPFDNGFATGQALAALAGATYPYTPTSTLAAYTPLPAGPDPDRTLVGAPRLGWEAASSAPLVTIPFGSDLNENNSLELSWNIAGNDATTLITQALRSDGFYTTTLDTAEIGSDATAFELSATFSDPEGLQGPATSDRTTALAVLQLSAGVSGTLSFADSRGGTVTLTVPADALDADTTLVISEALTPTTVFTDSTFLGLAFTLEAFRAGVPVTDLSFGTAIAITFEGGAAPTLQQDTTFEPRLSAWVGTTWQDIATTCAPTSAYASAGNATTVAACALPGQTFAAFNAPAQQQPVEDGAIYLPVIRR